MTLARMADRLLPLAERVLRLVNEGSTLSGAEYAAALDELLADIAAADRLARAEIALAVAAKQVESPRKYDRHWAHTEWLTAKGRADAALAAYRARMAQGVTHGA